MAWAKGTATDFIDFLRKMRDYAAGDIDPATDPDIDTGIIVPLADRWDILTNGAAMPDIPGAGFATDGEVYLQGPGSDPADEIFVGIRTYRNPGNNIWGWELRGYTDFNDTLEFETLPEASPPCWAAFDDATFEVHFRVNRRRIIAVARIGTTDIMVHVGFIQQAGTRSKYPYPLLIAGAQDSNDQNFQAAHYGHSCLPDPCDNGAQLRWVDGSWVEIRHYVGDSDQRGSVTEAQGGFKIWPHRDCTAAASDDVGTEANENEMFTNWQGTGKQFSNSEIDAYEPFQAIIHSATQLVGRIDGLYIVPGLGLVAGDEFNIPSGPYAGDYDIFKNTWRGTAIDFYALKRE